MYFFRTIRLYFILSIILLLHSGYGKSQDILINEVMSSNAHFISDEDGSFEDWIELYNANNNVINLEGFGLSNDSDNPFKWVFPAYEMQPGGYLLIWASGKDRKPLPGSMKNGIQRRWYPNIPGTSVNNLINHESFPDRPATRNVITNYFEAPTDIADNYGQHLFTWLVAPITGDYRFQIASDDNSALYLSSSENPDDAQLIASVPGWTYPREWDKYSEQLSNYIPLIKGETYYLSALMKEGTGGDNLSVRWQLPGGVFEEPLSAAHCYVPAARWHTNFKLSSAGEELILTNPQGIRIDEMPPVPIPSQVSLGRLPNGGDEWVYFEHPTPEAVNSQQGFSGITKKPVLFPSAGVYSAPVEVSIFSFEPDAQIYYTTNGSLPSAGNGVLYQQPFVISNTAYVRARAVKPGYLAGKAAGATYSVSHQNLAPLSSNLPMMIIHSFNTDITPGERTTAWMSLWDNTQGQRAQLMETPDFSGRIKINIRGSSSQMFPKKGYGFHILEEDNSNRKVPLLGMPEEHNWILHGPYSDKSLMRNALSYAIAPDAGHYSPRTRFVELFLHKGTSSLQAHTYHGVYLLTERIKVAPGRVEVEDLEPHHNEYPEVSGGYIFKIDRLNPGETGFFTNRETHFAFVRPNEESVSPAQKNYLVQYLDSLESALFGNMFADPEQGYAAFLDSRSFIDMHLITELTKEIDGYRLSTFFNKERKGKIKSGPLWDFNLALGNSYYLEGWNPQGWYYNLISEEEYVYGWYNRMFEDPAFEHAYNRRYRSLRLTAFSDLRLNNRIMQTYNHLREAGNRNFDRWDILGTWIWPNWFIADTFEEEVLWMANWQKQRLQWMDSQLGEPLTMIHYWNFGNKTDLYEPTWSIHGAELTIQHPAATSISSGTGNHFMGINDRTGKEPSNHLKADNPAGSQVIFHVSSENYRDLMFSYEAKRSANGANTHIIMYSVDGEQYIPIDTVIIAEKARMVEVDLSNIPQVNNNAALSICIYIENNPDMEGGFTGNNRIDNVAMDGEALTGVIRPPLQIASFDDPVKLIEDGTVSDINLEDYFRHPDGEELQYSVSIDKPGHADVWVSNQQLSIQPLSRGGTWVQLEVNDGFNPSVRQDFYVLVYPGAIDLSLHGYTFNYWSPNEPQGSFPENMLFMQGETQDPHSGSRILHAYAIPESDYAPDDQQNIGFPYRNQNRTRINGLNNNGISFINTGRDRDLGAAILALNTQNSTTVNLSWKASTLRANQRVYGIRLQYRTEPGSYWKDWRDENGEIIEYHRGEFAGHFQEFNNLPVPPDALGKPYLQIRWLYHFTGTHLNESGGARDMLGLHYISVNDPATQITEEKPWPQENRLKVYPNPVSGDILFFNKPITGTLYTSTGMAVKKIFDDNKLQVSGINPGFYILVSANGESVPVVISR
ncbi:MAG: hypothetical protein EA361_08180 [Bacteroidetes bacterium]|nr:MAG: hypothetical protein EA361_08180 [Bacteroidota bacterium]